MTNATTILPRLIATLLLLAAAGAALLLTGALPQPIAPTAHAQTPATDYDANDNGLIDINSIAQLNAIRWDIDGDGLADTATATADYLLAFPNHDTSLDSLMGCPAGNCAGYELTANLAFAASATWTPVADYDATLDGAGHTITGLNVNVASGGAGLFSFLEDESIIRDLGLINPNVTSTSGDNGLGALAGIVEEGSVITGVYAQGGRIVANNPAGGQFYTAGGLVGGMSGLIRASYSLTAVSMTGTSAAPNVGGLLGDCWGCTITASYAAGPVTATGADIGGLVGELLTGTPYGPNAIINSYCDQNATGQPDCIGAQSGTLMAAAYTTAQLQTPTVYAGIYRNWNLDLDSNDRPDYPWNFGTTTTYPTLNSPAQRAELAAAAGPGPYCPPPAAATTTATDYDANNNCLIDIANTDQLHALRYDLDGNGETDSTTTAADYLLAFPNRSATATTRMGCPHGLCRGYELTASLTFATSATWTPIAGSFAATLDGAGHTITGLTVTTTSGNGGMFTRVGDGGIVRDLGLINADIAARGTHNGILAGSAVSGSLLTGVYAQGGRININHISFAFNVTAGGLVGFLSVGSDLRAAWSTAAVSAAGSPFGSYAGGLVGHCAGCAITASYAAGAVTSTVQNRDVGGLTGQVSDGGSASSTIADSYCNPDAAGLADCIGNYGTGVDATSTAAAAYAAGELQAPTDYTGIYLHWNVDLDGDARPDYPWNFGAANDYPTLHTPAQRAALTPAPVDYDANNNGLIDVSSIAQLHAIRWDWNGDGRPARVVRHVLEGTHWVIATTTAPGYGHAFAGRTADMGCPPPGCRGYELTASLTFPAETGTDYNPWTPISRHPDFNGAAFVTTFDGNGHTLTNLRIERVTPGSVVASNGLFAGVGNNSSYRGGVETIMRGAGVIRNVGLVNPRVTSRSGIASTGALVGVLSNGSSIRNSYVQGGRISSEDTASGAALHATVGGLVGVVDSSTVANSYSGATVTTTRGNDTYLGGLVGRIDEGALINSYAYGPVPAHSGGDFSPAGLIGRATGATSTIADSYCDTQAGGQAECLGYWSSDVTSTIPVSAWPPGLTTAELQAPTGYTGIYRNWAPAPGAPSLWDFGGRNDYPKLCYPCQPRAGAAPQPGAADRGAARPPAADSDYNPAADHPEIYANDRYEMAATCQIHRNADGEPTGSAITFNLGSYEGEVLLALTLWNGDHFASYERMDAPHPTLDRNGQTATVQVATNPSQTRFLLDGRPHGLRTNLLLGYADCHTDDPGAEQPAPTPTPPPTPAPPKVYRSDHHEMTATCRVTPGANGNPATSQITFDLGDYDGEVTLHLSLWNGEYYATYESHNLTQPNLERNGQTATVQITTDPAETLFLLNTSSQPTRNLLLGHADCHTAR